MMEKLIGKKNRNAADHIVLGTAYLGLKQTDADIKQFEAARNLEPNVEGGYLSLGIACREQGDYRRSLKELEKVVQMKPDWSTGYYQMGETYLSMKEYDQALKQYRQAARLSQGPDFVKKSRLVRF